MPVSRTSELLLHELNQLEDSDLPFPVSIEVAAPTLDPWQWLNSNSQLCRIAWCERDGSGIVAGVGIADEVQVSSQAEVHGSISACRQLINGNRHLRFFGGLSFSGSDHWQSFGRGRFVLPRLTLSGGKIHLAVMSAEDLESAKLEIQQICFQPEPFDSNIARPVARTYSPTIDGWQSNVDEALSLIRNEVLEKIVLSRKAVFNFEAPLNPVALTKRLQANTNDCFIFCFNFDDASSFVGATPERLFFREGNRLQSEVVAGTRMRGQDPKEDEKLAIELLTSDKDQREHDIVRKSIRQKLHKYIDLLEVDSQASILRLARKQHLRSNVQGNLKPEVSDGMLLERLHPTPAVGGYPTDNALPEISRIEPFDRGWYAAPVGWIGADSAQFAVAIRSGLIQSNTLSLYSGAGIVRGSDPDEEWQEVENKIQDFISVLG
jgi:menaquinone-specific isochorismate synthase